MLDEPTRDIESSGTFLWQGTHWPMKLRLRGASTRRTLKKFARVLSGNQPHGGLGGCPNEPMDHAAGETLPY